MVAAHSLALAATRSLGEATLESRALAYGRVAQRGKAEAVPCRGRPTRPSSRPLGREPDRRQFPSPASMDAARPDASRPAGQGRRGAVASDSSRAANDLSEPSVGSSKPGINRRWSARWTWPRRATWAVSLRPIALWHASKSTSVAKPM